MLLDDVLSMVEHMPSSAEPAQSHTQWQSSQIESKWPATVQTDAAGASVSAALEHKRAPPAAIDAANHHGSATWREETKTVLRDKLRQAQTLSGGASNVDALVEWLLQRFAAATALPAIAS